MASRIPKNKPLLIRARDNKITILSDELPGAVHEISVDAVWDVQESLALIEPHLILLDLALPITAGANLLKLLHETFPNVPVVTKIESMICEPRFFVIEPTEHGITMKPMSQPPPLAV
jgi:CheY-like chemotaxis protein